MAEKFCGSKKRQIEYRPLDELVPYARNARTHSDAQVAQLAASIREFGWTNPILVDEQGGIIAGHGRLLAAHTLGIEEAPCITIDGLSEAQRLALIIADNKLALNASWNEELLSSELLSLEGEGFDLALLGFDDRELAALLSDPTGGLTDPDEIPEPPAEPVSCLGDAWILGKHRIVCGDSTDAETVALCLNGVLPHLMVTDPPYGVKYDAEFRNGILRQDGSVVGARATGKVLNDDRADWREAWALFLGDVAYVWHAGVFAGVVAESLLANKFDIRAQIIWVKQQFAIGRGDYHWQHEPCWYAVRKGKTGHYCGGRKQSTVWEIPKPAKSETGHSTQKPVECMKRPIENNSIPGQAVYEPFSGSGTTIIAGEMTARPVHAIELNPAYVDVAIIRWQEFTGAAAVHAKSGKTFHVEQTRRAKQRKAA
jgi:DNA modification methylase